LIVELKLSRTPRVTGQPFKHLAALAKGDRLHCEARALAKHWLSLYLQELRWRPNGPASSKTPGILDYSSRRERLYRWPKLYESISTMIRGDTYRSRVLDRLAIRMARGSPPPHLIGFIVALHKRWPPFGDDPLFRRLQAKHPGHVHCRPGFAQRVTGEDRMMIVSRDEESTSGDLVTADITQLLSLQNRSWLRPAWIEVPTLEGLGHGIEVWHRSVHASPVAFVRGYEWLHSPKRSGVEVELLAQSQTASNVRARASSVEAWRSIISDAQHAVLLILTYGLIGGPRFPIVHRATAGRVRAVMNA
jgi:hypothetical protein